MITEVSGKEFWAMMKELDEMNRQIIERRAMQSKEATTETNKSLGTKFLNMGTGTPTPFGSNEAETPIRSTISFKEERLTKSELLPEFSPSISEVVNVESIDANKTNAKIQNRNDNQKSTAPELTRSETTISPKQATSIKPHIDAVQQSLRGDNHEHDVVSNTLIYSGVVSGCLLAVVLIAVCLVLVHRRKNDKGRFTTTDQKTFQNTKIFVMGSGCKENNIVQSFNAIPADQNLWKELQSSSQNVF